jgi:hypothetical protein
MLVVKENQMPVDRKVYHLARRRINNPTTWVDAITAMGVKRNRIYWWDVRGESERWTPVDWFDWGHMRFHGGLLPGIPAGDHYFVVCILADNGDIINVISHRYILNEEKLPEEHSDQSLTDEERAFWRKVLLDEKATRADLKRLEKIQHKCDPMARATGRGCRGTTGNYSRAVRSQSQVPWCTQILRTAVKGKG